MRSMGVEKHRFLENRGLVKVVVLLGCYKVYIYEKYGVKNRVVE
jgi:hypothetical protein